MTPTTVHIVGNLTRDPELRYTPSGTPLATFAVAVNKSRRNDKGEWEDAGAEFFNCTAWRGLAENLANSVEKGQRVLIVGNLTQRTWEADDGAKRSAVEITAQFAGPDLTWATATVAKTTRRHPDQAPAEAYDPAEEAF